MTGVQTCALPIYRNFSYALWMHPYQLNMELQTYLIKPILDAMKKVIPANSVVIDIGAHSGDTSVAYSLVVGENGTVIAFEPNKAVFEVLQKNAELNKNIIAVNKAITEEDGIYTFHYTDPGLCNGGYAEMLHHGPSAVGNTPIKVEGINLEKWLYKNYSHLLDKIKFIKIDTEGYDRFILASISNLVKKLKPIIQCELYPALTYKEKSEFFKLIESLKYECCVGNADKGITRISNPLNHDDFCKLQGHHDIMCFFRK